MTLKTTTSNGLLALGFAVLAAATIDAQADGTTLRMLEDEWRRVVSTTVYDSARREGIATSGTPATSAMAPDRGTMATMSASDGSVLLYLSRGTKGLKPGLYQAAIESNRAALFYFDPAIGRVKAALRVPPGDPAAFHTPIGDDMCRNADDLLMDFCQTFVACAAYDFLC